MKKEGVNLAKIPSPVKRFYFLFSFGKKKLDKNDYVGLLRKEGLVGY